MYNAAVITISDKGYRGERVDTSGPNLVQILKDKGFDVEQRAVDVAELCEFEECGACGTGAIITPLGNVFDPETGEKFHYGDEVGPVLSNLYRSLQDIQYGRVADIHNWCVEVE